MRRKSAKKRAKLARLGAAWRELMVNVTTLTRCEDRAKLMQWWADYLDGRKTGKVLKMKKRAA